MSRDDARTHITAAIESLKDAHAGSEPDQWTLDAIAHALLAVAETQLEQLELARRIRTK